jgi:membrane fusion protein (multidrug efflux system)
VAQANLKVERYKPLVETNAISKQEFDDALTAQKQTASDLAAAKAALENARLNLNYATVTAPISGQIGRALVTEGALVGQGEATPLALIQQLDPIYVNISQSSADVLRLRRAIASGQLKSANKDQYRITLVTEDGRVYPQPGKLLFSDMSVDESSGSIMMRAAFPNPDRTLLPGMYVRARLDQAINDQAITIPQQALVRGPDGASVMLVGADGKVTPQPVQADTAQDNKWVISKGLKAGDRVIVEGFQKAKPGSIVKPMPWQAASPANQKVTLN